MAHSKNAARSGSTPCQGTGEALCGETGFCWVFGPQTGVQKNILFPSVEGAKSLENQCDLLGRKRGNEPAYPSVWLPVTSLGGQAVFGVTAANSKSTTVVSPLWRGDFGLVGIVRAHNSPQHCMFWLRCLMLSLI